MHTGKVRAWVVTAAALSAATTVPSVLRACDYHWSRGLPEPVGVWPTQDDATKLTTASAAASAVSAQAAADAVNDAAITSWMLNTTGKTGHSTNATINATVSTILADVQTVAYTSTNVYIKATGIPSHDVGPFPGNPATPTDRHRTVDLPRNPQVNPGTKTNVGLGNIGVMVNGVGFFDARDAQTYNNQGVWHQNANKWEASSFDNPGKGHPAPDMQNTSTGAYHYHQAPLALLNQLDPGNTGQHASPLIGFAFDGFPVYGPYDHANTDGTGDIIRVASSYALRNITQRTTLPDGTTASSAGPTVSSTYPLGSYIEDYAYTAGSGTLDPYNGRWEITPEYPNGTYCYHLTLDDSGAVYPYIIGPQYYGIVQSDNLPGGTINVPANVTYYTGVPEPTAAAAVFGLAGTVLMRRRKR